MSDPTIPTPPAEPERQHSRCTTCSKRIAHLGPPQPVPCPNSEVRARDCRAVLDSLVLGRSLSLHRGQPWHPETQALFERWGGTIEEIDAEIARRAKRDKDSAEFRYGPLAQPLREWIAGSRDRALIVVEEALAGIDLTSGGTRTLAEIMLEAASIGSDVEEIAAKLGDGDWETEDAGDDV